MSDYPAGYQEPPTEDDIYTYGYEHGYKDATEDMNRQDAHDVRAENEKLRAAIMGWAEAKRLEREAYTAWRSAYIPQPYVDALEEAKNLVNTAGLELVRLSEALR